MPPKLLVAFPGKRVRNRAAGATVVLATQKLLQRFRSRRPMRGGSLIVTIFGDAIAPRGGLVTLGSLIRLAAPFGLTERLVRTSVARLAQGGWLIARRDGRRSEYRLTAHGQHSFAEATRRIYGESPSAWNGQWTLLLLASPGAKRWPGAKRRAGADQPPGVARLPLGRRRDHFRDELRWLGFGQVGPGTFLHPSSTPQQARQWLRGLDTPEDAVLLSSSGEALPADRRLVAAGWDLADLARRYRMFVKAFTPAQAALRASASPAAAGPQPPRILSDESAFVIRTLLIHEYRKIHLQDPLLPPQLLPQHWIGAGAYDLCRALYGSVFAAAEEYLSRTASTLSTPLPSADRATYERFGGIG